MIFFCLRLFFYSILTILLLGCSSASLNIANRQEHIEITPIEESFSTDGADIAISDTINIKNDITSKLELARQHYLSALEAYENDDSIQSVEEFETAIKILDELSYYPEIEKNEEFTELSKSLIEDYEKLITTIDELESDAPIFALREKINSEAELIDVKKENIFIPKELPKTTVPFEINEKVEQFVAFFMERGHKFLPTWFYRSGIYFPMMRKIFAEEGLPQELIYLSLVESGLNPTARSWASAVGLWQFVKKTGEIYNLKGNIWWDERRNPEKATRAAARHLKDLYDIYQDWHLVLAAYNCGAGRVNYALRRAKSDNFWSIYRYLPRETRGYVPQYIAISLIFINPERYGFAKFEIGKPFECDTVNINESIDLNVLAKCVGISDEDMVLLNPELVQGCTPPNITYAIKIPKDKTQVFTANLKNIPQEDKRSFFLHLVKKGETPSTIAKKYKISQSLLVSMNNLDKYRPRRKKRRYRNRLPVGIALKIPIKYTQNEIAEIEKNISPTEEDINNQSEDANKKINTKPNSSKTKLIYLVKDSDNLKRIASLYDVRISDLRNWNDIAFGKEVEESDSLEIWIPENKLAQYKNINTLNDNEKNKLLATKFSSTVEKENKWITHRIRKGETLSSLASDYNVEIKSIKRWNKMRKNTVILGQKIKIYARVPSTNLAEKSESTKNNKMKEITYTVKAGETLYSIARKSNVPLHDLLTWNKINDRSKLKIGQVLRLIPRLSENKNIAKAEITEKSSKNKTVNSHTYKVKKGDNLYTIANAYNVSIEDIKNLNDLPNEKIKKGQILKINSPAPSSAKGDNAKPKTSAKKETYKVKKGDTLYSIAKKFGVKVDDLKKWNRATKNLKIGAKLVVYR
jgi:membrane-bound lytic murein transglycosylase D